MLVHATVYQWKLSCQPTYNQKQKGRRREGTVCPVFPLPSQQRTKRKHQLHLDTETIGTSSKQRGGVTAYYLTIRSRGVSNNDRVDHDDVNSAHIFIGNTEPQKYSSSWPTSRQYRNDNHAHEYVMFAYPPAWQRCR